jgi:hypothetical protein
MEPAHVGGLAANTLWFGMLLIGTASPRGTRQQPRLDREQLPTERLTLMIINRTTEMMTAVADANNFQYRRLVACFRRYGAILF